MSARLTVTCESVGCSMAETVEIGGFDRAAPVAVVLPAGWGWDWVALDLVLHCPSHREIKETREG